MALKSAKFTSFDFSSKRGFARRAGWDHILITDSNKENVEGLLGGWKPWAEIGGIQKMANAPWQYFFFLLRPLGVMTNCIVSLPVVINKVLSYVTRTQTSD